MPLPLLAAIPAMLSSMASGAAASMGAGAGLASGIGAGAGVLGNMGMSMLPGLLAKKLGIGGAMGGGMPGMMGGGGNIGNPAPAWGANEAMTGPQGAPPRVDPGMSQGGPGGIPLGLLPILMQQMGRR